MAVEERGELFPEEALRVKNPERAHMLDPVFEAETIVLGNFFRNREAHPRNPVPTSLMSNTGTIS